MLEHFSILPHLYVDIKRDKGRRLSSMVTMETEYFWAQPADNISWNPTTPKSRSTTTPGWRLSANCHQGQWLCVFFSVLKENMLRTARPPFLLLTVCDLQQGFGNDTPGYVESLAAIEAAIRVLNVGNGQTTRLGDREAAEGLRRLVGEEETLGRR